MVEKCFGCSYDGDALTARCAFHAANPDETTHDGLAGALEASPAPALELAIEQTPVEVPCPDCSHGIVCAKHMGRRPYSPPAIIAEQQATEYDVAVLVDDEAPKTPRDRS
jgi:hypothetical protein